MRLFMRLLDTIKIGIHAIQQNHHLGFAYFQQRFVRVCHLITHINSHMTLTYVLTRPTIKYLTESRPKVTFKYLGNYLSLSLSRATRLAILEHHYNALVNFVNKEFMENIIDGQIVLWEEQKGQDRYSIDLIFSDFDMEGDLSLVFKVNSLNIFIFSFIIAPGKLLNLRYEQVLFITRVQGVGRNFDLIKYATKNLNEISPRTMLLVAVEAIATALGISGIAGICAKDQVSSVYFSSPEAQLNDYDDYWEKHGGIKINDDVFDIPVPLPHKPLSMIKQNHRSRTKRKRRIKKEIAAQVCQTFVQKCLAHSG